ncbi:hypothetical protein [Burkholderia sp. LMG 13014]|nr:hypothetical protein [Burkholderia sp. LMG 13014]
MKQVVDERAQPLMSFVSLVTFMPELRDVGRRGVERQWYGVHVL